MALFDQASIKEHNKFAILRLVKESGPISRTEISQRLKISRTTATLLTNELCQLGLLKEEGQGTSHGGRKPSLLVFNADYTTVAAIELGATKMAVALTNLNAEIRLCEETPLDHSRPDEVVAMMAKSTRTLLARVGVSEDQLLGVGVSVPGLVDSVHGIVEKAVNLGWENVPLRSLLEKHFHIPIRIVDKGDAGALGEKWFGRGRTCDNFIYITVGTGVGAGIISGGQLYSGARHAAGEVGHITAVPDGPRCLCGNVGCVELYASASAVVRRARESSPPGSPLAANPSLTAEDVYNAAVRGDKQARAAFAEAGAALGAACVTLVHLFNPELLIFGGGVAQAGEFLLGPVREIIHDRVMRSRMYDLEVVPAGLGMHAGLAGAAALVIQEALSPKGVKDLGGDLTTA